MNTKHTELLSIQNSAEETPKSNSNYERQKIENTPFWIIGDPENGYNLIMGKWKLTPEPHKTKDDLKRWMNRNMFNIMLSMIISATQDIHDLNNEEQQQHYPKNKFDHDPLTDDITPKL